MCLAIHRAASPARKPLGIGFAKLQSLSKKINFQAPPCWYKTIFYCLFTRALFRLVLNL